MSAPGQQTQAFHAPRSWQMNTIFYLLPDNCTNKVQPADTGFGRIMREKIVEACNADMVRKKENLEMGHDEISAKNISSS